MVFKNFFKYFSIVLSFSYMLYGSLAELDLHFSKPPPNCAYDKDTSFTVTTE